jgi:hypothetical protein
LSDAIEAIQLSKQAAQKTGQPNALILDTLAASSARAGIFSDAIRYAEQARHIAAIEQNTSLVRQIDEHLLLFHRNTPYSE